MIFALFGCDPTADPPERFLEALHSGDCSGLRDPGLRDDCREATATSAEDCDRIEGATMRGECWFQLAERTSDPSLCPKAVPFADDCAMHVISAAFSKRIPRSTRPGEGEDDAEAILTSAGLSVDDPRPWSAFYRQLLGANRPIDRQACLAVKDAVRRDACLHTGIALYQDLLNHARDTRKYPCDLPNPSVSDLPILLQYTPDAELDAVRAARTDLCNGPLGAPPRGSP
mgnify:CR=1 FL=1